MAMKVHIERAAKALEKRDRARVDVRPLMTLGDRLGGCPRKNPPAFYDHVALGEP
jgi:hypothetical protein